MSIYNTQIFIMILMHKVMVCQNGDKYDIEIWVGIKDS